MNCAPFLASSVHSLSDSPSTLRGMRVSVHFQASRPQQSMLYQKNHAEAIALSPELCVPGPLLDHHVLPWMEMPH